MKNLLTNIWARDWVRRLTWRTLTLVTLIILLGTWLDHRWARQWQSMKQRLADSGETTDFRRITTEPLPEAKNFCAIPLLKDISLDTREAEEKRQTIERYCLPKEQEKRLRPDLASGATLGTPVDLEAWGLFLQGSAADQTALPSGRGAERVRAWAKPGDSFFDELAAGLERPSAQWTPPWKTRELPAVLLSATMPHYQTEMALAKTLRLRTSAAASLGEGARAVDSLRIGLRLSEASFEDPFLISLLVGLSQMNGVVNGIWDCAAAQSLDADQWGLLSRELRRIDLEDCLLRAFRGEMTAACNAVDYIKWTGDFELTGEGRPVRRMGVPGGLLDANAACANLIGLSREELRQRRFTEFIEDAPGLVRGLKNHRSGKDFVNVDITIRNAAGAVIDCLMTATYLGTQDGHRNVFQAIIKDVTDRRQEQKRLEKLNADLDRRVAARTAQLLEALEDLGSFSYSVAHDLRSPLKNIAALSELLRTTAESDPALTECRPFAERIERGATHLIQLVDDLLRFSQTSSRVMERKEVPLVDLVNQAVTDVVPEERQAQITVKVGPEATVIADAPMLKVVLHNLLSNALKFTRDRLAPAISIEHQVEQEHDLLVVRDNGVGFDAKQKDQVFGVFKRMHRADQFEGTGVGLAIVHRVVAKHGGEVWAESTIGQGTAIHIKLPRHVEGIRTAPFIKVA